MRNKGDKDASELDQHVIDELQKRLKKQYFVMKLWSGFLLLTFVAALITDIFRADAAAVMSGMTFLMTNVLSVALIAYLFMLTSKPFHFIRMVEQNCFTYRETYIVRKKMVYRFGTIEYVVFCYDGDDLEKVSVSKSQYRDLNDDDRVFVLYLPRNPHSSKYTKYVVSDSDPIEE